MKGGNDLTEENQSYLRFSLEESVWFQKGQEVAELYSISLDPNVTIQEDEHYVYMRGTLDLSGEYKDSGEPVDGDVHTFLPRSVQTVERHPNGISEFIHRFPVDITIPSTRITSLDDIEVTIQTFDYTLPERNCLKLQADLIISGIYRETYVEPELEDYQVWDDDESPVATDERQELDEEIEDEVVEVELADIRQEEVDEVEESVEAEEFADEREDSVESPVLQIEEESPVSYTTAPPPLPDFQPTFRQEEQQEGELYEPFIVEAKRTPDVEEERVAPLFISKQPDIPVFDFSVPKFQEREEEQEVEPVLERKVEKEQKAEPVLERKVEEEQQVEPVLEQEIKGELEKVNLLHLVNKREVPSVIVQQDKREPQQEEEKKVEKSEQKARTNESQPVSIMDFFSRKQEEEHVRVKVCIVQQGETIDDLAERYSVNPQTLLQSNELEPHQDIYEGQVLYIPRSASYKN